ncbi:toll-like receptor 4 [Physella acuta]|uniref:toll-like receptor 4 n=1 Tax=Physella acuta TaxID=109671 RepID=UPI0027DB9D5C|nr:toll-like receptor 4 [Physella acuta]
MARKLNPDFVKGAKPVTSLCPSPCQCSLDTAFKGLTVDCSNKGLLKIPDIPSHVTVLDLQNNRLTFITCQDFAKTLNLRILRLSHNKINTLEKCTFANLTKLEKLEITNNELSHVEEAFENIIHLTYLDLNSNTINTLTPFVFKNLASLHFFDISNALTRFDVDLYNIKNMEVLDLSNNLVAGFSENNCQDFAELKTRNPNFKIRIQSNPLMCTCEYLSFVHLLITHPDIFDSVDSINCTTIDGSNLSHDQLATFYPQLMKSCVSQEIFIGTLVTFFIVLGTVLLSAMFYYNRWKFAYLYFIGSKKLHVGDVPLVYKQIAEVFITYEQEPEYIRLARQVFIPWLKDNHVTYLHGEDHFQAGPQNHNIAGAIVGTRKTLVLLSRDIFEDRYRELEMNLAIMHEMNCSDRIIQRIKCFNL